MNQTKSIKTVKTLISHAVLIVIGVLWMYPFLWMASASFKTNDEFFANRLSLIPETFTLDNIIRIWTEANFSTYFINTVIVTIFSVIIVLVMTITAGYALGRYDFAGKKVLLSIFLASITIPLVSTIIPTYQVIRSAGLVGTKTGLILAQSGGAHVIFLMLFSGYFQGIPNELEDAAKVDGCTFFKTFWYIMMPLGKPISITVIIMQTIWTWNAFLLPLVLTLNNPSSRTLAVGLYAFKGENTVDWTGIAAGGFISVIPIILLYIFLQKYFVDGIAGAVKS